MTSPPSTRWSYTARRVVARTCPGGDAIVALLLGACVATAATPAAAHLSVGGEAVPLDPPTGLDAALVDGRLRTTFTRRLDAPLALGGRAAEVAFYEATHFYAFSVTNRPRLSAHDGSCSADIVPFEPSEELEAVRTALLALDAEGTPATGNVGALFADRIVLAWD